MTAPEPTIMARYGGPAIVVAIFSIAFYAGGWFQRGTASDLNYAALSAKMDLLSVKMETIPLDRAQLAALQKTADAGAQKDRDQDTAVRDLQEWVKSDREWMGRLERQVACATNSKKLPGCS